MSDSNADENQPKSENESTNHEPVNGDNAIANETLHSGLLRVLEEKRVINRDLTEKRKLVKTLGIVIIILSVGWGVMIFGFLHYPKYTTVQTVDNSPICRIAASDNPNLSQASIADFAKSGVINVYSYDYITWQQHLDYEIGRWFTTEGRQKFIGALKASGALNHIINNNLIMKTMADNVPEVVEQGGGAGSGQAAYWIVRMPVTVEFYAGGPQPVDRQQYVAQVRVVESDRSAFNPKGLGIDTLTLRPPKPTTR